MICCLSFCSWSLPFISNECSFAIAFSLLRSYSLNFSFSCLSCYRADCSYLFYLTSLSRLEAFTYLLLLDYYLYLRSCSLYFLSYSCSTFTSSSKASLLVFCRFSFIVRLYTDFYSSLLFFDRLSIFYFS